MKKTTTHENNKNMMRFSTNSDIDEFIESWNKSKTTEGELFKNEFIQ